MTWSYIILKTRAKIRKIRTRYLDALGQIECVHSPSHVSADRSFQLDVRRTGRRRIEQQPFDLFLFLIQHSLRWPERQLKTDEIIALHVVFELLYGPPVYRFDLRRRRRKGFSISALWRRPTAATRPAFRALPRELANTSYRNIGPIWIRSTL